MKQLERVSISDPAAGCSLTVADEIPYPDEPALIYLIEQLVKSLNDRDADLVNTLLAREEDQVEFIPGDAENSGICDPLSSRWYCQT